MCRTNIEGVEDGDNVSDAQREGIRGCVVRFVTRTMPTGIHEDESVLRPQSLDIPMPRPALHVPGESVLKNQGRTLSLDSVVNPNALIGCVWHRA
jgi:hypothetical protein